MMSLGGTAATSYISPGIYSEEVNIGVNNNPGYMVITKLSNESPILQGSADMDIGIYINSADNVIIKGLTIRDYNYYGIQIYSDATNNKIINNNIYNNDLYGIYLRYDEAQKNHIYGNNIWGTNQNYGIRIYESINNTVESNFIHNNDSRGIYLYRAVSNYIINNTVYSNNNDGINIYDSYGNYLFNNDIHGPGQSDGIDFDSQSRQNLIRSNYIFYNTSDGIEISLASSNYIIKNMIVSNEANGIYIYNDDSDNNLISSNIITGANQNYGIYIRDADDNKIYRNLISYNQYYGIYIRDADDNKIYRNLISYNQYSGIYLAGDSTGTKIINNTIFGSLSYDGIRCYDASSGEIYNNIILSNGNGSGDYGIENNGSGEINVNYNIIYGNEGGPTNGPLLCGNNNIFTDPLIDTVSSFNIASLSSPAVDSALIIPGITDIFYGLAPDIGWKESTFAPLFDSGPYFVATNGSDSNIGSYTNPFATIQKAADVMSKGVSNAECYIFPGTYEEQIVIRSNKNNGYMKFKRIFNERPVISGESFGAGSRGIFITNAAKVNISGFFIKGYAGGIDISGDSASNIISQSIIYSNKDYGIFINSQTADSIFILTNQIGGGGQNCGIISKESDDLNIFRNLVHNNKCGICLKGSSLNAKLINNTIYKSSTNSGILLEGTSEGEIYNNIILSNGDDINDYGIRNSGTGNIYAAYNNIYGNFSGPTNNVSGWGNGNSLLNPLLDTAASCVIASLLSPSVDLATNIPSVSDVWDGLGPDMGWQESSFTFLPQLQGPFYVAANGDDFNNGSFTNPFATIQRAVYVMSSGVSNAACYIFPGTYFESVKIDKNLNSGDMLFTSLSNQMPILTGLNIKNNGIEIKNANNIIIRGLEIRNFYSTGIYITGISSDISIVKSLICSNGSHGIELNSDDTMNISIYSNRILENQDRGIYIQDTENNIIRSNKIYNNRYGVYISSTRDNIIVKNEIYSNSTCGIRIFSSASYNKILTNIIWGGNQDHGIRNSTGDNNIIKHNKIFNNQNDGIYFSGSARDNQIIDNSIYSNIDSGINLDAAGANRNLIISNSIWGENQKFGISIEDAKDNEIYRNIIWKNKNSGISIIGIASNIKIINNSIYGSLNQEGIFWDNTSGGIVYNNIILSNGDSVNSYGIRNNGAGTVIVDYNNIYGNFAGPTNNGSFICGSNNKFTDPLLETTSSFTLMSFLSPSLDSGMIIPGISDIYIGTGPDMGAIESSFTDTSPPFFISISPYAGEKKVKTNVDISFYLSDNYFTLSNSVRVLIDGITALTNGTFSAQFNGPASVFSNDGTVKGYTITIDPVNSFTNKQIVNISIYAEDLFGNSILTNYNFTIENFLPPPAGLFAIPVATNMMDLSWSSSSNADEYLLYRNTNYNTGTAIYITNTPGTNYTDTGLLPDRWYYYWVKADNTNGESGFSTVASNETLLPPPHLPVWISARDISSTRIDLLWNDVSYETSYTLYYCTNGNTNNRMICDGLGNDMTNYSDTGLTPDTIYYYSIKAFNIIGESGFSTVTAVTTPVLPPATPTITSIISASSNQIDLTWSNVSNETSYTLFRNANNTTNSATNIFGSAADVTVFSDTNLSSDTWYYYRVKAYNDGGSSNYSIVASNITWPSKPIIVKINLASENEINLIWNSINNTTVYSLFRSEQNNFGSMIGIAKYSRLQTNIIDSGFSPNTTYYYCLKAYNPAGASPYSKIASATTGAVYPAIYMVFPTAFKPSKHKEAKIYFAGKTPQVEIIIYDMAGNIVKKWYNISNKEYILWDGKNDNHGDLNAGVYIIYIKGKDIDDQIIKMMIIR